MSMLKVQQALVTAYLGVVGTNIVTDYPGESKDPPAGADWNQFRNVPADLTPATMGDGGENEYVGFFQVNMYQKMNQGGKKLIERANALVEEFQPGKRYTYQGQEVKITKAVPSPIGRSDVRADDVIAVTVYWSARFKR